MNRVFFVDTTPKTAEAWQSSPYSDQFPSCPFAPFSDFAETVRLVEENKPDIVLIAPTLGAIRGMRVFAHLRLEAKVNGRLMINGVGVNNQTPCTPEQLKNMLEQSHTIAPFPNRFGLRHTNGGSPAAAEYIATAENNWGDVRCPKCNHLHISEVEVAKKMITCRNSMCDCVFLGKPFPDHKLTCW
jgi:hypothetical protein